MATRWMCTVVVVAAVLALPRRALAWGLDYDVAPECADAEGFRRRADSQRLRDGDAGAMQIRVEVVGAGATWRGRVVVAGAAARELAGASCAEVHDAAILIVAQLLDGVARPVPPPRPSAMAPIFDDSVVPPRPAQPRLGAMLGGGVGVDVGALPSAAPGGRASLELRWWRVVTTFGATRWRAVDDLDAAGEGLSVSAWQVHVALRGRLASRIDVGVQAEIGEVSARGRGVETPLTDSGAWQAIGPSARAVLWAPGRAVLYLELEALFPVGRVTFVVDGEPRYRTAATVRGFLGAGWHLF